MSGFVHIPEHEPEQSQVASPLKQITDPDHRFYERSPGVYYPSMTTVMSNGLPTPKYLLDWYMQYGHQAKYLLEKASKEGTLVHEAIEKILNGEVLTYEDFEKWVWNKRLNNAVFLWRMVMKFMFFYTNYVLEVLDVESRRFSDKFKIAGTMDLRARLTDGRIWIVDFKTSNHYHADYSIQTFGYSEMTKEAGLEVEARGVLHLKANTRGPAKAGNSIQGKGWQLIEHKDDEYDLKMLKLCRTIYATKYPDAKPNVRKYPNALSLQEEFYESDWILEPDVEIYVNSTAK